MSARPAGPSIRFLPWLDVARAVAALAVLMSHVRAFTLCDAAAQPALPLFGRLVFAATGLGHEAVIVFFVLSGFLVTRSMRRLAAEGHWSLHRFAMDRLSRLWLVLLPCLLIGGLLDGIGLHLASGSGDVRLYGSLAVTQPVAAPAIDSVTLIGNVLFLQTIAVPVFGSNGPLWSLADEAWFYGLAALAFAAWRQRRHGGRAALPFLALVIVCVWLPTGVIGLFPVWLCGAACAVVVDRRGATALEPGRSAIVPLACVAAVLLVSRLRWGPGPLMQDWSLGLVTAWLLAAATRLPAPSSWWFRPVRGLSAVSYSLYLSHVPLLALFASRVAGPHRLAFGLSACAIMAGEVVLALGCAGVLWWLFERHTAHLRAWLRGRACPPPVLQAALAGEGAVS